MTTMYILTTALFIVFLTTVNEALYTTVIYTKQTLYKCVKCIPVFFVYLIKPSINSQILHTPS